MGSPDRLSPRGDLVAREGGSAALADGLRAELGDPALAPQAFLDAVFELEPVAWLRKIPGRETFAHGEHVVIKRFRGDAWRERWHACLRGERSSPARREAENLAALRALGLCVPAPLLWCEDGGARRWFEGGTARSALAMERLEHDEHLRKLLARASADEVRAWLAPLAVLVARLHAEHWFHRDLYLQHFAVLDPAARRLALLDCGRARTEAPVPSRWIVKDLAQLLHSCPENVVARAHWRWLVLYARARPLGREHDLRALARRIAAKVQRMREHAPRHLDPRTAHADGSER